MNRPTPLPGHQVAFDLFRAWVAEARTMKNLLQVASSLRTYNRIFWKWCLREWAKGNPEPDHTSFLEQVTKAIEADESLNRFKGVINLIKAVPR
jgi:hypothetical protein